MATRTDDNELRDRSIAELLKRLADETNTLLRQEMELARAELTQKLVLLRHELEDKRELATRELPAAVRDGRDEIKESGKRAGSAMVMIAAAVVAALFGAGVVTASLILALRGVMPDWAAALVVAAAYLVLAGLLIAAGRTRLGQIAPLLSHNTLERLRKSAHDVVTPSESARGAVSPMPEQTIETLKEDVEWVKSPTRSAAR
jgi:hypothetical protein